MNEREVELGKKRNYYEPEYCDKIIKNYDIIHSIHSDVGGNGCTDAHKSIIKLLYLNYNQRLRFFH